MSVVNWKIAAGGLVGLMVAGSASAQHGGRGHEDGFVPPGLNAAADKTTGKLRALNADEARTLIQAMGRYLDQSSEGLTLVYHPNGMVVIDLDDRFQNVSLARVRTDGSVDTQCVGSVAEARAYLGNPVGNAPRSARAPVRVAPEVLEEK